MNWRYSLYAVLVVAIWGANFAVVKVGVTEIPPFLFCSIRFLLVAALVVPFQRITRSQLPGLLLLSTVLGACHFGLLFSGLHGVEAATGAILIQLGVPFSTLLATLVLRERLGLWRGVGLFLAFAGAAVLAGEPTLPGLTPFLLLVASAFCWALSNLLTRRLSGVPPLAMVGWVSLLAAPQVGLLSAIFEHGQAEALMQADWRAAAALAYVVLGSSMVAYTAWYALLARYPVNNVVPLTLLAPVFGVGVAAMLLGEVITWQKLAGGALTIGGVALIMAWQYHAARRRPSPGRPG